MSEYVYEPNRKAKLLVKDIGAVLDVDMNANAPTAQPIPSRLPYNRLLFGAPGTGKSYRLEKDRAIYFPATDHYERVTFHPAYSYAQFFGSYKPVAEDSGISYSFVPGPFIRLLLRALVDPAGNYLLVIEEINRADVAAVFGDVFQLLDRRPDGASEYTIASPIELRRYMEALPTELKNHILRCRPSANANDNDSSDSTNTEDDNDEYCQQVAQRLAAAPLSLPANFYIWATMNSADQGVMPLDTAFKRRWQFEYMGIDDGEEAADFAVCCDDGTRIYKWHKIRHAINDILANIPDIAEDRYLGPFFLKASDFIDQQTFEQVFKSKVLMYLYQDIARYAPQNQLFTRRYPSYGELCLAFDSEHLGVLADWHGDALAGD